MIKLLAFDLDGTLTCHKTPLCEENRKALEALGKKYKLLMVGAGNCRRIFEQMGRFPIDIIGNYGMQYAEYNDISVIDTYIDRALTAKTDNRPNFQKMIKTVIKALLI